MTGSGRVAKAYAFDFTAHVFVTYGISKAENDGLFTDVCAMAESSFRREVKLTKDIRQIRRDISRKMGGQHVR